MEVLDLKYIYEKLKESYDLKLTTGLNLNAGFRWNLDVLTGEGPLGTFYLYDNGANIILDYDTEDGIHNRHWHPANTDEALDLIVAFMEGTI